jgi:carbonic anhydrase
MSNFDALLRGNPDIARTDAKDRAPAIPFIPNKQVYIRTCIDPRVDPAQVFGLQLGDAIVARAVGGRVTPELIQDLAVLDPAAIPGDVEKITSAPQASSEIEVSGFSYDVAPAAALGVCPKVVSVFLPNSFSS